MRNLHLSFFRSWKSLSLDLSPQRLFITGPNGIGKTSILEALYLISRLSSFRTRLWHEIAHHGSHHWQVDSDVGSIAWHEHTKSYFLPHKIPCKPHELYGRTAAVYISRSDTLTLLTSSENRRAWLDSLIAMHDTSYITLLRRWRKILAQRNAWLRSPSPQAAVGQAIESLYIEIGWQITQSRSQLVEKLNPTLQTLAHTLSPSTANFTFDFLPSFTSRPSSLSASLQEERSLGYSLIGPHRDDWRILINKRPLQKYASEGQIQIAILALKLTEAHHLNTSRSASPWLLLDDILAPLDTYHRSAFIQAIPQHAPLIYVSPSPPDTTIKKSFASVIDLENVPHSPSA
ncbi:MAG: DNA replication and repair protein RecF [Methylacidiphilales bacterium]|nr:DNA replication and repair protein RecF [Candidatus Methylacidiphilales bacterium]MDW8349425.1 DNA replication and repair protein RecF [Verrucomicrobiae bacterium]